MLTLNYDSLRILNIMVAGKLKTVNNFNIPSRKTVFKISILTQRRQTERRNKNSFLYYILVIRI